MNCRKCEEVIYSYPESTAEEQEAIRDHIQSCVTCREKFDQLLHQQQILKAVSKMEHNSNDEILTDKIMEAVYREKISTTKQPRSGHWHLLRPFRLAAAIISLCLIVLFVVESTQASELHLKASILTKESREPSTRLVTAGFITARAKTPPAPPTTSLKSVARCLRLAQSSAGDNTCNSCNKCNQSFFK